METSESTFEGRFLSTLTLKGEGKGDMDNTVHFNGPEEIQKPSLLVH